MDHMHSILQLKLTKKLDISSGVNPWCCPKWRANPHNGQRLKMDPVRSSCIACVSRFPRAPCLGCPASVFKPGFDRSIIIYSNWKISSRVWGNTVVDKAWGLTTLGIICLKAFSCKDINQTLWLLRVEARKWTRGYDTKKKFQVPQTLAQLLARAWADPIG